MARRSRAPSPPKEAGSACPRGSGRLGPGGRCGLPFGRRGVKYAAIRMRVPAAVVPRCVPAGRASNVAVAERIRWCTGRVWPVLEPLTLSLCHSIAMAGKTSVQREASAGGLLFRSGIKRHNRTTGRQSYGPDYREAACKETAVTSYPLSAGIAVFQEHQRFQFPGLAEEAGPLLL